MEFLVLILVPIIIGMYAQAKVSSAYEKYSRVATRSGATGRDAAAAVMQSAGIDDVQIVEIAGHLTDHYDPTKKVLALSTENYRGRSIAALGVAAHEAGHAIQHKCAYAPLNLRMALVPITNFACSLLPIVMLGGFFPVQQHDYHLRGHRNLHSFDAVPAHNAAGGIRRVEQGEGATAQLGIC